MIVKAQPAKIRETQWWEYAVRFLFGGLVTALAGLAANEFGPLVGGLFLAFPGIFPASATLVERHERKERERRGLAGVRRGREVSAVVAAGAALGGLGLVAFAVVAWRLLGATAAWKAIGLASLAWLGVSVAAWIARLRA
jgi:hypothetical protein